MINSALNELKLILGQKLRRMRIFQTERELYVHGQEVYKGAASDLI